jgi:hypothetical protein
LVEIAKQREAARSMDMPYLKIFFLPDMSAILPMGTKNMAAAKRYEVVIQLNETACIPNSFPMEGRAMLTEEPMKGVRKEVKVAISKAALLVTTSSIVVPFLGI